MIAAIARSICFVFAISASILRTPAQSPSPSPSVIIPDESTAIRVAEAIFATKYNVKTMEGERPYKAHLSQGVWLVWGTVPKDAMGQTLFVQIDQKAGCVLRMGPD